MNRPLRSVLPLLTGLLAGCAGLKPLPQPSLPPCGSPSTPEALFQCIERTDQEVGAGIGSSQPKETAFRSTVRVAVKDLRRRKTDQRAATACGGPVPAGFSLVNEEPTAPGRAPLRAYFKPPREGRATLILVHGLYDSKHSRYARLLAGHLAGRGFGVLVPDMRFHGCLLEGWLPTLGLEEGKDLAAWSDWLRRRDPESPVGLLGFSLGALSVIHALALDTTGDLFRAGGIAVSPPSNLPDTLTRLDDPPSFADRGLQSSFQRFFRDSLLTRMDALGIPLDPGRPRKEAPFDRFLRWLVQQPPNPPGTTPERLLELADPRPKLALVRRPLLLIGSRRDPIFPDGTVVELRQAAQANPNVRVIATTDGGHIGQMGIYPRWFAEILERFFGRAAESLIRASPVPPGLSARPAPESGRLRALAGRKNPESPPPGDEHAQQARTGGADRGATRWQPPEDRAEPVSDS